MRSKYIDYKVTLWRRIYLKDEADMTQIIGHLAKSGNLPFHDKGFDYDEILYETEEDLSPIDNNFESTIEIIVDGQIIWTNDPNNCNN